MGTNLSGDIVAEESSPKKKRIVKNPETFRERAAKASVETDQPKRGRRLAQAGSNAVSPVTRPVGKLGGKVFNLPPLRFLGKILVPPYLRNSWQELRLVTWPSWAESRRLTYAVLIFAIIFGAIIAIVDYGLDKLFRNILLK